MASSISASDGLNPLTIAVLEAIARGESVQIVIDKGYSHWQLMHALQSALKAGFLVRRGDELEVTTPGLAAISSDATKSFVPLAVLTERRLDSEEKSRPYAVGRQTLEHIRNRVRPSG